MDYDLFLDYLTWPLSITSRLLNFGIGGSIHQTLCNRAALNQDHWGWWLMLTPIEYFHRGHTIWALMTK